jgi:hypothetical protein
MPLLAEMEALFVDLEVKSYFQILNMSRLRKIKYPHPPKRGSSQLIIFQSIEKSYFDVDIKNVLFGVDSNINYLMEMSDAI